MTGVEVAVTVLVVLLAVLAVLAAVVAVALTRRPGRPVHLTDDQADQLLAVVHRAEPAPPHPAAAARRALAAGDRLEGGVRKWV